MRPKPSWQNASQTLSQSAPDQIERTYLAKKGRGGISVLYMMEEEPDSLRDLVLHESGRGSIQRGEMSWFLNVSGGP